MREQEVSKLIEGTSDPSFVVDAAGAVVGWNKAAEEFFGIPAVQAIGKPCCSIFQGTDDDGVVCSTRCAVRQCLARLHPVGNFDLKTVTVRGTEWCNVSVVMAEVHGSPVPHAIHIVRSIDASRRIEATVREFIQASTGLSAEETRSRIRSGPSTPPGSPLSPRETEILRRLARGGTSSTVAGELHISKTTVNNHVQSILRKLNAHSRLEAIRRAEHSGLV